MKSSEVDNVEAIPYRRAAGWSTREILNRRKRPTRRKYYTSRASRAETCAASWLCNRFRFIRSNKTLEKRIARFVRFLHAARCRFALFVAQGADVEIVGHDFREN